jgi:hypothetical protein
MINVDTRLLDSVTPDEYYLLSRIADRMNSQRTCWPGISLLMRECGWSKSKVLRTKAALEHKNLIRVEQRRNGSSKELLSNLYTITCAEIGSFHGSVSDDTTSCQQRHHLGSTDDTTSGHPQHDVVSALTPKVLVIEVLNNEVLKKKQPLRAEVLEILPFQSESFRNAWENWKQYNREHRRRLPPSTIKAQLHKLARAGEAAAIAMIEQSIEKNWKGLFPVEERAANKSIEHKRSLMADVERRYRNKNIDHKIGLLEDFDRRNGTGNY